MSSNQAVINGRTYSMGKLSAVDAVRVEVAIAKVIGEPLFKALMGKDKLDKNALKKEIEAVGATAMGLILSNMDADVLLATMATVFSVVSCDGERIDINSTFTGRNKDLWLAFFEALRFNFSDFLPESLSISLPVVQAGKK